MGGDEDAPFLSLSLSLSHAHTQAHTRIFLHQKWIVVVVVVAIEARHLLVLDFPEVTGWRHVQPRHIDGGIGGRTGIGSSAWACRSFYCYICIRSLNRSCACYTLVCRVMPISLDLQRVVVAFPLSCERTSLCILEVFLVRVGGGGNSLCLLFCLPSPMLAISTLTI